MLPPDPGLAAVNRLLDGIVVQFPDRMAVDSCEGLLTRLDEEIDTLEIGAQQLDSDSPRRCLVCGKGSYAETHPGNAGFVPKPEMKTFYCNYCGHIQAFLGVVSHSPMPAWKERSRNV